jgi:hypothetical protein
VAVDGAFVICARAGVGGIGRGDVVLSRGRRGDGEGWVGLE